MCVRAAPMGSDSGANTTSAATSARPDEILRITKQSLARVLKQLVDEGWIVQKAGERDRRQRLLHATEKGVALARCLDTLQAKRVGHALAQAGGGIVHDSSPEGEWQETLNKLRAVLRAAEMVQQGLDEEA